MSRTALPGGVFIRVLICLIPAVCSAGGLLDGNLQCVDLTDLDGDLPLDVISSTQILVRDQDWEHSSYGNSNWPTGGTSDVFGYPTVVKNVHGLNQDDKYYLYYAHHDPMSGIGCAVADNIEGPYTKEAIDHEVLGVGWTDSQVLVNPNYRPESLGGPNPGGVAHFSSPSVVWNEDEQLWFMYFHYFNHYYGGAGGDPWNLNNPGLGHQMTALATCADLSSHNWTIWTDPVWDEVSVWDIVPVLPTTDEAWMESASSYHAIQRMPGGQWLAFMRGTSAAGSPTVGFGTSTNGRIWSYFPENPVIAQGKAWAADANEYRPKFIGYLGDGEYLVAWAEHPNPYIIYSTTTNFTTFQRDSRGYAHWGIGQDGMVSAWREGDRLYLFTGKYVHEMVLPVPPPPDMTIDNGTGATDITHTGGVLQGNLSLSEGAADVCLYWGTADGGATAQWQQHAWLTGLSSGSFSNTVSDLSENTLHYYRCYATNAVTSAWADASETFITAGTIPFEDTFEDASSGPLHGQHGWRADPTNTALVYSNGGQGAGSWAVHMSAGRAWHAFSGPGRTNIVWTDCYLMPSSHTNAGMTAQTKAAATAMLCVDPIARVVDVYDGRYPIRLHGFSAIGTSQWVRVTIRNDYLARTWDLWIDGTNVARDLLFHNAGVSEYSKFIIVNGESETDETKLDNVSISRIRPYDIPFIDDDDDGLDDDWEDHYFGSTTNSSAGSADDWDEDRFCDLYEFLAGTDPTDPASLLAISNVWIETDSELVVQWTSAAHRRYAIIQASHLLVDTWSTAISNITATPPLNERLVPLPDTPSFYRIHLEPPLPQGP